MKCKRTLFAFMFMLMLTSNLNAQEASPENTSEPGTAVADVLDDAAEDAVDAVKDIVDVAEDADSATEPDASVDKDEVNEVDLKVDAMDEDGVDEDDLDEDDLDEDDLDEDDLDEEYENTPISIKVNENGELVGQARASVSGNWLPVEANIALVSNGVLLGKILADPDGSFAFQDIAPGDYNLYGTASSFCGQRVVTVLPESSCCDNVGLGLTQESGGTCYSDLASAPAATFSGGAGGGFAGAPVASGGGGGFAGGGGIAAGGGGGGGFSALRLLTVGGVATAIAVGVSDGDDDDEASPAN